MRVIKDNKNSLNKNCLICNSEFEASLALVAKGYGKYCSSKCFGVSRARYFKDTYGGNTRICRYCNIEKESSEFSPDNRISHKRQTICKKCKAEWMRLDRIKRPDVYKEADIKKSYGIDLTTYNKISESQGHICAICGKKERMRNRNLHIDHNHKTGIIRGLLCGNCNVGIGNFKEDINVLKSAIIYLEGGVKDERN